MIGIFRGKERLVGIHKLPEESVFGRVQSAENRLKKRGQYSQYGSLFFSRFVGSFQSRQKADSSGSLCIY